MVCEIKKINPRKNLIQGIWGLFGNVFKIVLKIFFFFDKWRQLELKRRQNRGCTLCIQVVYKESRNKAAKRNKKPREVKS